MLLAKTYPQKGMKETFIINEKDKEIYDIFSSILFTSSSLKNNIKPYNEASHYIVGDNRVTVYDQNYPKDEANYLSIFLEDEKVIIEFSCENTVPSTYSIRIIGMGRPDGYPFKIPFIEAFNSLYELSCNNNLGEISK